MSLPKAKDSLGSLRSHSAQERQKLFLQELEGRLITPPPPPPAPPPPAASRRHTGHKRKGTASANSPISVPSANMLFQAQVRKFTNIRTKSKIPNRKKIRYRAAIPSTREKFTNTGSRSGTIGLRAAWHASLATTIQKKWNYAYKSNRLFQFCS